MFVCLKWIKFKAQEIVLDPELLQMKMWILR